MRIFFSVGEPSGDIHGARLIEQLRRLRHDFRFVGFGGPEMAHAGCEVLYDLTQHAIMFFLQVVTRFFKFWKLLRIAKRYFEEHRIDAVVLIDYPGFNWWIARAARKSRIPVFYFGAPQIWAWAPWRIRKVRRLVDYVLCQHPFEARWYAAKKCNAKYVGHPFFDDIPGKDLRARESLRHFSQPNAKTLVLLPGSRDAEVTANLDSLLRAAETVLVRHPQTEVVFACFSAPQANFVRSRIADRGLGFDVLSGKTSELISIADVCIACSGSVSLQLLAAQADRDLLSNWSNRLARSNGPIACQVHHAGQLVLGGRHPQARTSYL